MPARAWNLRGPTQYDEYRRRATRTTLHIRQELIASAGRGRFSQKAGLETVVVQAVGAGESRLESAHAPAGKPLPDLEAQQRDNDQE